MRCYYFLLLIIASLLSGCSLFSIKPMDHSPAELWQMRYEKLDDLAQWSIKGRTVITQDKEAWNAGIHWHQDQTKYQIKLLGPFSQGGVSLDADEDQIILTLDDGRKLSAATPEALIYDALGVNFPVSALHDWIRGIPSRASSVDVMELDDKGQISLMEQQGWTIRYLRYSPFQGNSMPTKIFIKHPDLSLKLIILSWSKT